MNPFKKRHLATAIFLIFGAGSAFANTTSSGVRGIVTGPDGAPLAGSTVTISNSETGYSRTIETGESGEFNVRGLRVGGNYTVEVSEDGYSSAKSTNVFLEVGQFTDLDFSLKRDAMEEVVVIGTALSNVTVASGPNAIFDATALQSAPITTRDLVGVLRADPRIYVDESSGSVSCGSQNPRFNSLTVDGVRMNDSFGLNSSGYPTERMPFPYDAIDQVAVEMAPFDVVYGGFTACNINAVTHSGTNEFHGSVFFDYVDDSLRGDSLEADKITQPDFDESRFGFTVGGPIIEDKLFFFAAYEKLKGVNTFDRGAIGSGAINEVDITQAELDRIVQIADELYQYDPGAIPSGFSNDDEKLLFKVDWNINDDHRVALTYNYNDGYNIVESDGDLDELEFSNHLYERGAKINATVATWYADWSDIFSSELRVGKLSLNNRQNSLGGTDFGEMQISTDEVTVYIGGDDSRQSNKLTYDTTTFSLKGYLDLNAHYLTFGLEREMLNVYNLFVQHSETEIRFASIDDFEAGNASAIYYNNAPDFNGDGVSNPNDAAADWGYALNTAFVQDDFTINDTLSLVYGLRYDWYTTSDTPTENPDFTASYGFANTATLDGVGLLQPRLGLTWDASDAITVRSGVGLFSGGNPNVWLSNTYSANNVTQVGARGRDYAYTDDTRTLFDDDIVYLAVEAGAPVGPGYGIPQELYDQVAGGSGSNFEINYLDPDFKLPSDWKFNLGATWEMENDYLLNADILISKGNDTAVIKRGDLDPADENADGIADVTEEGYPVYESNRDASFVLTNSSKGNESFVLSLSLTKSYDFGVDWTLGYAYSDAKDVQPMTSSVAFSNYQNRAFFDPQADELQTSNYNIRHRLTAVINYEKYFWDDNATRVSFYSSANTGLPYSDTLDGNPNDIYGFNPFLEGNPILASANDRNANDGSWWVKADLKVEQELGGFFDDDKASVFLVVDNFANFINDEWGVQRQAIFPGNVPAGTDPKEARVGDTSLYEIRFGLNYTF